MAVLAPRLPGSSQGGDGSPQGAAGARQERGSRGGDPLHVARVAAAAARGVAAVEGLEAGPLGTFATYGRGDRVPGVLVRLASRLVEVRLVVAFGWPLAEVADDVRQAVLDAVERLGEDGGPSWRVDVRVSDVVPAVPVGP